MDERIKKMKITELEILQLKTENVVREIVHLLAGEPDQVFDDDFSLVLTQQCLNEMYKELIKVVDEL